MGKKRKEITGVIYMATSKTTGKSYIGQTNNFRIRKSRHLNDAKNGCDYHFHRAIIKYGKEDFSWIILWEGVKSLFNTMEWYYVRLFDSYESGYNSNVGGDQIGREQNGNNNPSYDNTLYTFYHKDGNVEKNITQHNMRKKYNISPSFISVVIKNNKGTFKGWALYKKDLDPIAKFSFIHKDGLLEFNVSRTFMSKKYNLGSHIFQVCTGDRESCKGWRLYNGTE